MEVRVAPLYEIFKFNTRFYLNALDGMDDDQAGWRAGDKTNSPAYIALHILDTRHSLLRVAGVQRGHKFSNVAKEARGKPDFTDFPSLDQLREEWKGVTGDARALLARLTDAELNQPVEVPMPLEDKTLLGYVSFAMMHESYHIGQLSLLRKQVGLSAMALR